LVDVLAQHIAVLLHVVVGDLIGDALVAESRDQPIKDRRGIMLPDCGSDTISIKIGANLVDQARGTGKTADPIDHANCMIDCGCSVVSFGMFLALALTMLNSRRGDHGDQIIETNLR
jgi:hypothetical protein